MFKALHAALNWRVCIMLPILKIIGLSTASSRTPQHVIKLNLYLYTPSNDPGHKSPSDHKICIAAVLSHKLPKSPPSGAKRSIFSFLSCIRSALLDRPVSCRRVAIVTKRRWNAVISSFVIRHWSCRVTGCRERVAGVWPASIRAINSPLYPGQSHMSDFEESKDEQNRIVGGTNAPRFYLCSAYAIALPLRGRCRESDREGYGHKPQAPN